MGSGPVWKEEHKEQLYELYAGGVTVEDIARKMHRTPAAITSAIVKARTGKWGDDYKQRFNACLDGRRATVNGNQKEKEIAREDPIAVEASKPEEEPDSVEDIVSEAEPEIEPEPEEKPEIIPEAVCTLFREDGGIDMIKAIEALTSCGQVLGMDKLVEVRGSNRRRIVSRGACVVFTTNDHTYALTLDEED